MKYRIDFLRIVMAHQSIIPMSMPDKVGAATTLKPPGAQTGAMDMGHLADAWLSGLRHDDPAKGGCPPCPPDSPCPSGGEDGGGGWAGAAPRRAAAGPAPAEFLPPPGVATQTALH